MFFTIPFAKILINFRIFSPFICTRQFQRSNIRFIRTHYDILNVRKGCTYEEIKSAFITLSKKYHPDINKNANAHSEYTKILEAYNVLAKPERRRLYDLQLSPSVNSGAYNVHSDFADQSFRRPRKDPSFWVNRDRSQDSAFKNKPYYGIEGVPKLSNGVIAWVCLGFAVLGVGFQVYLIKNAMTVKRDKMILRSAKYENYLTNLRNQAEENGNLKQIELLTERFKESEWSNNEKYLNVKNLKGSR